MALNDPPYYRDSSGPSMSPLMWLFAGTLPLGEWGGVRVGLHASIVVLVALIVLLTSSTLGIISAVLLAAAIVLVSMVHEAGHWLVSKSLGVTRRDALVSPLGNAVDVERMESPRVVALTALGGPLANLLACTGAGGLLWILAPSALPWDPLGGGILHKVAPLNPGEIGLFWVFVASYVVMLINLLPIYPLDGGHVLHAALRPRFGFIRGLRYTCVVGIFGSLAVIILGVVTRHTLLIFIAAGCAISCVSQARALRRGGEEPSDDIDYSAAYEKPIIPKRRRLSKRVIRKARKASMELKLEQERLDAILAKVSKSSLASLTWQERRALKKATERRRRQDSALG